MDALFYNWRLVLTAIILFFSGGILGQSVFSSALDLDGTDDYVSVVDHPALNLTTTMTLEVRVWSTDYNRFQWQEFVMKGYNPPRQYMIRPRINDGRVQFIIHDDQDDIWDVRSDSSLVNGTCYHLAGTYDGNVMSLYVNGVLQEADTIGAIAFQQSDAPLTFGRLGGIGAEYYRGQLNEVRLWNVARSESQIRATMNDTLGPAYYSSADSGLAGYWRLDEGSGNTAIDHSVNGNHGTLENGPGYVTACVIVAVDPHDNFYVPDQILLYQNYPNPFNPATTIGFRLPESAMVRLSILDLLGREIRLLAHEPQQAGSYEVTWDGRNNNGQNVASGIYYYRLQAGQIIQTKKLLVLR